MGIDDKTEQLRRQVDDLAMKLVMEEAPSAPAGLKALSIAIEETGRAAQQAGCAEAASIASGLAGTVSAAAGNSSADLSALAKALKDGIANLQRVVAQQPSASESPATTTVQQSTNLLIQDMDLLNDVIMESREHLSSVEAQLLRLEKDPADSEAIHSTFRSFHTIKGLAGFLELTRIQEFSHEVETVLDSARNGKLAITPEVIDVVLASKDYLGRALDLLEPALNGSVAEEPPLAVALLERLRSLLGKPAEASQPQPSKKPSAPAPPAPVAEALPALTEELSFQEPVQQPAPSSVPSPAPQEVAEAPEDNAEDNARGTRSHSEARVVKVDTAKLDYLVDMAGEMMIAESQVRGDPDLLTLKSPRLQRNLMQLARRCGDLQKTAMAMRMVPVGQIFRRLPRLVRDLARKAGKKIELDLVGEETELDRTIVEELWDPLIHMVRNSIDHGIETPEVRQAAGKDPVGRILLKACHQAGNILIEASDDGRGIDVQKVLAKGRERGLVSENAQLPESDILNLIFEPGFSTAEKVTEISGRGVGMDVVRKHIQKLRGRIDVQSIPGHGSKFLLKLPLTLAIIDGLVIGVGRERYVVPLFAVREMFRPTSDMVFSVSGQGEMVLIRGALLPILRLYQRFNVEPRSQDPAESVFIVAEIGGRVFCLMVDEFTGKQQVVIKSLGDTMKNLPGIAGGTILGDGRVALVLDLDGVFEQRHD